MVDKNIHMVDLRSLETFTEHIGSNHQDLIQDFGGQLFHYTDLNALISIVGNHDLWFTNSRYSKATRNRLLAASKPRATAK